MLFILMITTVLSHFCTYFEWLSTMHCYYSQTSLANIHCFQAKNTKEISDSHQFSANVNELWIDIRRNFKYRQLCKKSQQYVSYHCG